MKKKWLLIAFGACLAGVIAWCLLEKFWVGEYTIYYDNCKKKATLIKRLKEANVPFTLVEKGGVSLGKVKGEEVAAKLGLPSLFNIEPDPTVECN